MKPEPNQLPEANVQADKGRKLTTAELAHTPIAKEVKPPDAVTHPLTPAPHPNDAPNDATRMSEANATPDASATFEGSEQPTQHVGADFATGPDKSVAGVLLSGWKRSDSAVERIYPGIGDTVQIDVDRVERMKRKDHHQWLIDRGLHGALGRVVGAEVNGGVYMLVVDTGSNRVAVDAAVLAPHALPEQPQAMQDDSRISPERMKKKSDGSYNLT